MSVIPECEPRAIDPDDDAAEFRYVVQWVLDEKDTQPSTLLAAFTADEIADLVAQARDAWNGGAR